MSDQSSQVACPAELGRMTELIFGFISSQAIAVAAKLGIADLLQEEPKTAEELANATKAHAPSLNRLLRMLTGVGVFAEDVDRGFHQTRLSELLRSDHPRSARAYAMLWGSELHWRPWGELYAAVMSGRSAFEPVFGAPLFEYLAAHPGDAKVFNNGMSSISAMDASAVVEVYDFSRFERIVDVGGGHGWLLRAILTANSKLRGVLADQPSVVAGATALRNGSVADRCEITGVDFFTSVPEGADAYILKLIIHDWDDEAALGILRSCRRAVRRDGTLLIIDSVLKPSNQPDLGKFRDLNMLVVSGGRERTEAEFATLLGQADFSLTRVIPTSGMLSIIESQPA
jgi:hypothetical protein